MQKKVYKYPAPLRGLDEGTFTEKTVKFRLPKIVQRVLAENELNDTAVSLIQTLIDEIPYGPIRPLRDAYAPDFSLWNERIAAYAGQNWLEAPWFFVETYKFRRIIEAVDYYQTGLDPFAQQKSETLRLMLAQISAEATLLNQMVQDGWSDAHVNWLLLRDLWGNQVDLGLWAADDAFDHLHQSQDAQVSHLLVNDLTAVLPQLKKANRLDFIIDNAGYELVGDFLLAAYLLLVRPSLSIHFHVKRHPTFVSDVTVEDVSLVRNTFMMHEDASLQQFGLMIQWLLENGRLSLHNHLFWTSPDPLWEMPIDLFNQLAESDLIISKGDANYRRALGDLHWPYETPLAEIVINPPAPMLFLRTCKAEVLAGLGNGRSAELRQLDPEWDVNGKWGVIQLVEGKK
ncbi:MAG: damage-control phosphatase ARMT1 family protein [Chloroflexota bacterium]